MFCESYERKLKDLAATGEAPGGDLRRHLTLCAKCAEAWEQEQALFAAIELNLAQAVSADVPASLVAGVRQRVAASQPQVVWWKPALALTALAVVIGGIATRVALHKSDSSTQAAAPAAPVAETSAASGEGVVAATEDSSRRHLVRVRTTTSEVFESQKRVSAEILISPAEAAGLQQYMQQLRTQTAPPTVLEQVKNEQPFAIRDVEFAEIDLGVVTIAPLDGAT
jgi:hypothetical protein